MGIYLSTSIAEKPSTKGVQKGLPHKIFYTWPWGITYGSIVGWMNVHQEHRVLTHSHIVYCSEFGADPDSQDLHRAFAEGSLAPSCSGRSESDGRGHILRVSFNLFPGTATRSPSALLSPCLGMGSPKIHGKKLVPTSSNLSAGPRPLANP